MAEPFLDLAIWKVGCLGVSVSLTVYEGWGIQLGEIWEPRNFLKIKNKKIKQLRPLLEHKRKIIGLKICT